MVEQGEKIRFKSRNDGQVLEGRVLETFTSQQVRDTFGGNVMRVETADRGRGWELISDEDVQRS